MLKSNSKAVNEKVRDFIMKNLDDENPKTRGASFEEASILILDDFKRCEGWRWTNGHHDFQIDKQGLQEII